MHLTIIGCGDAFGSGGRYNTCFLLKTAKVTLLALLLFSATSVASDFKPINKLTTWYTDRSLIDVEVPALRKEKGEDIFTRDGAPLRIRLERAYVTGIISSSADSKIVSIEVDRETLLPRQLLHAKLERGRFKESLPSVPEVPFPEQLTRTLLISINARELSRPYLAVNAKSSACVGESVGPDLYQYKKINGQCRAREPAGGGDVHIGNLDGFWVIVQCHKPEFRGIGCRTRFPFEGFFIGLGFHRNHLARWKEVVGETAAFLKSKQYDDRN